MTRSALPGVLGKIIPPRPALAPSPIAELLNQSDRGMNYFRFIAEARKLLGDAMPEPATKAAVTDALRRQQNG